MDLGLLLFGVFGLAYGLTSHETKSKTETPKLPDCPQGCRYEFIDNGRGYIVPIVRPDEMSHKFNAMKMRLKYQQTGNELYKILAEFYEKENN